MGSRGHGSGVGPGRIELSGRRSEVRSFAGPSPVDGHAAKRRYTAEDAKGTEGDPAGMCARSAVHPNAEYAVGKDHSAAKPQPNRPGHLSWTGLTGWTG